MGAVKAPSATFTHKRRCVLIRPLTVPPAISAGAGKAFIAGRNPNFYRINCGTDGALGNVRELVREILPYAPQVGKRHVVFFDEAQRLSIGAQHALLVPAETTNDDIVFVFSLIDADALPGALRDRCRPVSLLVPSQSDRLRLLNAIAAQEGLALDQSGMNLLASQSASLRQLTGRAEALAKEHGLALSEAQVRLLLLAEGPGPVFSYLTALVAGDRRAEQESLAMWQAPPSAKYEMVRLVLLHLKLGYLSAGPPGAEALPLGELLEPTSCVTLVERLAAKAEWLGATDLELMDQMLEFWSFWPAQIGETEFNTQVVRFHDRLASPELAGPGGMRDAKAVQQRVEVLAQPASTGLNLRRPPQWAMPARAGKYISGLQGEAIWRAGSFLLLEYGLGFNVRLEVRHKALGITDERIAIKLMSDLARELGQALRSWHKADRPALHRITLHEALEGDGLVSSMILHIPRALQAKAQKWILERYMPRFGPFAQNAACTVELEDHRKEVGVVAGHWRLARSILRGLDPEVRLGSDKLIDLLGVPRRKRRAAGPVVGKRYSLSEGLSTSAQARAAQEWQGWPPPLREQDWKSLDSGWEIKLRERRVKHRANHLKAMKKISDALANATDSLTRQNLIAERDAELTAYQNVIINQTYDGGQ